MSAMNAMNAERLESIAASLASEEFTHHHPDGLDDCAMCRAYQAVRASPSAMRLISNFAANIAHRNLKNSDAAATSSLNKLSSGSRVVSAKDDAASQAIGSALKAEVMAMEQATVNARQAGSLLQIADGAMANVTVSPDEAVAVGV